MTDGNKQTILGSIHDNLAVARRFVQARDHDAETAPTISTTPISVDRETLVQRFTEELTALGAQVFSARTADGAREHIRDVVKRYQAERIAISAAPILKSLAIETLLHESGAHVISLPNGSQSDELAEYKRQLMTADLGITGADYGLAESGTLVLQTGEAEGRLASLLPPVHVAVLNADQILPSVVEFITQLEGPPRMSCVTFITGPSRTADIELTLTVGVHGPKELHALILC